MRDLYDLARMATLSRDGLDNTNGRGVCVALPTPAVSGKLDAHFGARSRDLGFYNGIANKN